MVNLDEQFNDLGPDEINPDIYYYYYEPSSRPVKGMTLLMRYVLEYRKTDGAIMDKIESLLENEPDIINKQNGAGYTALMIACRNVTTYSSNKIVKLLIDYGAELDIKNNYGNSALNLSCIFIDRVSNLETVMLLITNAQCSIDINTILHEIDNGLLTLAETGHLSLELLKLFVKKGLNIYHKYSNHDTIFMKLIKYKNVSYDVLRYFLENCNLYHKNSKNQTVLQLAIKHNPKIVDMILEYDCDLSFDKTITHEDICVKIVNRQRSRKLYHLCCAHIIDSKGKILRNYLSKFLNNDIISSLEYKKLFV